MNELSFSTTSNDDLSFSMMVDGEHNEMIQIGNQQIANQQITNQQITNQQQNKNKSNYSNQINQINHSNQIGMQQIQQRTLMRWQEDSSVTKCQCGLVFGFLNRKHHCRLCSKIYCDKCSQKRTKIPKYLNVPTPAGGKEFSDNEEVRVCEVCFQKLQQIKQMETLIDIFYLINVDIVDLKNMKLVCKTWNQLSNFYLSKFREIQYVLPSHTYNRYEINALWTNRKYLYQHSIWFTHLLCSIDYSDQKNQNRKGEILHLLDKHRQNNELKPNELKTIKHRCWYLMCNRRCSTTLSAECCLMLLNHQRCVGMPTIKQYAMESLLAITRNNPEELCCYIQYLIYNESQTKDFIILDYLIDEINKFEVGKGLDCNTNRNCIKIANEVYWEIVIGIQSRSVFIVQTYKAMYDRLKECIPEPFWNILLASNDFVDNVKNNYNSHSSDVTNLIRMFNTNNQAIIPLFPENGPVTINVAGIEVKSSITRPVFIPTFAPSKKFIVKKSSDSTLSISPSLVDAMMDIHQNVKNKNDTANDKHQNDETYLVNEPNQRPGPIAMFKREDIRTDQIIMSIIKLMYGILNKELGMDLGIITYRVRPTGSNEGFIEIVQNCCTLYKIQQSEMSLLNYILEQNTQSTQHSIRVRFIKSCAAYCVITYLLGIGDRHLENIMVTNDGRLFHIDYGFILGQDPKPLNISHMRISTEMLDALGGIQSKNYEQFKKLCDQIYNTLRRHLNLFACLLGLFHQLTPRIQGASYFTEQKVLREIVRRFAPGGNYQEAKIQLHNQIENSTTKSMSYKYAIIDFFHRHNKEQTIKNTMKSTAHTTYTLTKNILSGLWDFVSSNNEV